MFDRKKRAPNQNNYNSFSINNVSSNANNSNDNFRRSTKACVYSRYNKTTQIINLPGGVKRNLNEINDDKRHYEKRPLIRWDKPTSYSTKIFKDYKSNVACLPGSGTINVPDKEQRRPISTRRFQTNDIFNTEVSERQNDPLLYSGKKINISKRSNNESTTDIYQNRFQGIKKSYKNYSQIQLC